MMISHFLGTFRVALRALRRNAMRSALTTLGIVIGVAAVIAMIDIGQGSAVSVQQTIASMGANNLIVQPGTAASGGTTFGAGSVVTLTPQDAEAIGRECAAVASVAPQVRVRTHVVYGNRNWVPPFIWGTTPAFHDVRDWQMLDEGEPFTDRDVRNARKVCLLGRTVVRELFPAESPLGKEVRIQNVSFKVIGVLSRKGANMMGVDLRYHILDTAAGTGFDLNFIQPIGFSGFSETPFTSGRWSSPTRRSSATSARGGGAVPR